MHNEADPSKWNERNVGAAGKFGERVGDTSSRLAMLGDLHDFQVAEGYPDIRGWNVVAADNRTCGRVHELIVDIETMRTRYLDIRLDSAASGLDEERDVLVPIGTARLDDRNDRVILDEATASRLASLPQFTPGNLTRDHENALLSVLGTSATGAGAAFYSGRHFDDREFYRNRGEQRVDRDVRGEREIRSDREVQLARSDEEVGRLTRSEEELTIGKRQIEEGEVDIRKHVETEHVARPVTTSHEEVTIERQNIDASRAGAAPPNIRDEEIRVPLVEEEAVVEKRPILKEELVIKKHAVPDTKQIEADIRKERIDVEDTTHGRGLRRDKDTDADLGGR